MKLVATFVLCLILFFNTSYKPAPQIVPTDFKSFLAKFKPLQLPHTIKINRKECVKFNKSDNQFVKSAYPDETYAYGILPDTTTSYKLIWLEPAETYMPYLATFTKSGKLIKKVFMVVGQCGSGCCYQCNEFTKVNKDLTFISIDSIKACKCDVNGPIANTDESYVLVKTGKVFKDGNITMTDYLKKAIITK